jgi:hypothetical protein
MQGVRGTCAPLVHQRFPADKSVPTKKTILLCVGARELLTQDIGRQFPTNRNLGGGSQVDGKRPIRGLVGTSLCRSWEREVAFWENDPGRERPGGMKSANAVYRQSSLRTGLLSTRQTFLVVPVE